jgi:serine/threonine protein kinase
MRELGQGGSARVYLAWDNNRQRQVAVKMLKPSVAADPLKKARFQNERQVLARLDHAHIVRHLDAGECPAGAYLVLECVPGGSLNTFLGAEAPSIPEAVRLVEALSLAVAYLHSQGLAHGDLKPSNILLQPADYDGQTDEGAMLASLAGAVPKIADFELAQSLGEANGPPRKGILGTPGYMAPEQARNYGGSLSPAVDIYALGAILYRLIAGQPPFRESSPRATLERQLSEDPLPPSRLNGEVSEDVDAICRKCLARDPDQRYASAEGLARDLHDFLASATPDGAPVGEILVAA